MRWRVILSLPLDGAENMALDAALMDRARITGESALRVYSWSAPVLSLGRNQTARNVYDHDELFARGISVVRRPTGGRALLHDHEVTYSLTAPAASDGRLSETYTAINALLLHALASLGVPATLARTPTRARHPTSVPCFSEPAAGEIVVAGRKLVGSAQWRDDGALLQHGSIIVENDQLLIPALMRAPIPAPPEPATLRALLGRTPEPAEIADALFDALREVAGNEIEPLSRTEVASLDVDTWRAHFRNPDWTWRR